MPSLVELLYNPYVPRLKFLLNGKQPPDFSQLVQFTDEDIWHWSTSILDAVYSEIRDDFYIEFTGTPTDAEIMRFECNQYPHCLGFKEKSFTISDPLQKRLGRLNQFIKKQGILDYQKAIIDSCFIIPQNIQHILEDVTSIDIGNLFCAVRIETSKGTNIPFDDGKNAYLFSLADTFPNALKPLGRINHQNTAFAICLGNNERFCGIQDDVLLWETTEDGLVNTIFQCFLTIPLLAAFRGCIRSLPTSIKKHSDFLLIDRVEPEIVISVDTRVEASKSVPISVSLNPCIGSIPQLSYHTINCSVVDCDGISVFGKQRGTTTLEVYRYGEKKPFFTQDIEVYVRNRIKTIILSEDEIVIGIGDIYRLNQDYIPDNADNANTIRWKSTDEKIAKVDQSGRVLAVGIGTCRILCTAENVSTSCSCTVKPYLEEITTDIENNSVILHPAEERKFQVNLTPSNCIDNSLEYVSSNYDIVNIVRNTLLAKNEGTATVTIRNKSQRRSVVISVTVEKQKEEKKPGFLKKLFHKE